MPTRRQRVGDSLQDIGQFISNLLLMESRRRQAAEEERIRSGNAIKLEELRSRNDIDINSRQAIDTRRTNAGQRLAMDPGLADRLTLAGSPNLDGVDVTPFQRTTGERLDPFFKEIAGAKTPTDLPDRSVLTSRATLAGVPTKSNTQMVPIPGGHATPLPIGGDAPIDALMRSLTSRNRSLVEEQNAAAAAKPRYEPGTGAMVETRPGLGTVQTTPTTAQKAASEKEVLLGSTLSPEATSRRVGEAGRTAGAQAEARQDVEMSPGAVSARVMEHARMAAIDAFARNDPKGAGAAQSAQDKLIPAVASLQLLKAAWNRAKTTPDATGAAQRLGSTVSPTGVTAMFSPNMAELDSLADGLATTYFDALGGRGVASDQDMAAIKRILVYSNTDPTLGDRNIANLELFTTVIPAVAAYMADKPGLDRMPIVQRLMGLALSAPPEADIISDPMTGIRFTNPRKGVK